MAAVPKFQYAPSYTAKWPLPSEYQMGEALQAAKIPPELGVYVPPSAAGEATPATMIQEVALHDALGGGG